MKRIVFDSGPLITLAMNGLLWILEELKKDFNGEFIITKKVKEEIVDKPMKILRFKFEAIRILSLIEKGVLTIVDHEDFKDDVTHMLDLTNNIYYAKKHGIKTIQTAEIEAVVAAKHLNADAVVIDERTTRMMMEKPKEHVALLSKKLHTHVEVNEENSAEFIRYTENIPVLRSSELVLIAYDKGLLDKYLLENNGEEELLHALLWGIKLHGCAISTRDISALLKLYKNNNNNKNNNQNNNNTNNKKNNNN